MRILWERDHKGVRSVARCAILDGKEDPLYSVETSVDNTLVYKATGFTTEVDTVYRARVEFSRNVMRKREACTRR